METNNIDKIVRDSFKSRIIEPSNSSWERLSDQLTTLPLNKKNNWFLYLGYAASLLLILSVAFFMNNDDVIEPITPKTIVIQPIDSPLIKKHDFKTIAPVEEAVVESSVKQISRQPKVKIKQIVPTFKKSIVKEDINEIVADASIAIKNQPVAKGNKKNLPVVNSSNYTSIKIDSDALLYAVTHSEEEVKQYYKKYKIDRVEALKTVRNELKRMHLKIDASLMLTEVEKSIGEDSFKRNFMNTLKGKVTGLAVAFSNRNN